MAGDFSAMSYGPIGKAVEKAAKQSEADPVGIYAAALALFSAAINGYVEMDTGRPIVVWTVLAGRSSIGRKGTALDTARAFLDHSIGGFLHARKLTNISSGPALVNKLWHFEMETAGTEGGMDGRAILLEEEWATPLKRAKRCPTFTQQLRSAWDGKSISNTTKKEGTVEVYRPLLGMHAHITPAEWAKYVSSSDALGGSFNRLLPVLVEKARKMPYNHKIKLPEIKELTRAYEWARKGGHVMSFSTDAGEFFDELRDTIEDRLAEMPEEIACYMERSAEQVARVAAVLTAAERKTEIPLGAVKAAWAFVQYSMVSVEKLVRDAADKGGTRADKPLPDLIREILARYGGEASSTLMLRALGARATAAGLKAAVEQMPDVERVKGEKEGRGAKPIIYRFRQEETGPEPEPKVKPKKERKAPARKAAPKKASRRPATPTETGPTGRSEQKPSRPVLRVVSGGSETKPVASSNLFADCL